MMMKSGKKWQKVANIDDASGVKIEEPPYQVNQHKLPQTSKVDLTNSNNWQNKYHY